MQIFLSFLALLIAAGSFLFTGVQTRILAKQTTILSATSRLSYSVQLQTRLQDILFAIADDPDSHAQVWGKNSNLNKRPEVATEALLDVMAMAKAGTIFLPGFDENDPDWDSYISFVLSNSGKVRTKLLTRLDWWPELESFVQADCNVHQDESATEKYGDPHGMEYCHATTRPENRSVNRKRSQEHSTH